MKKKKFRPFWRRGMIMLDYFIALQQKQTVRGLEHEEAVEKLMQRAEKARRLYRSGYSIVEITQRTGFTSNVVRNYLSESFSPVNAHYGKLREGKLEPFRDELFNLRLEGFTYSEIHKRICEKGYTGTQDAIRGFFCKERRIRQDLHASTENEPQEYIDKKWIIRLLYKPIEHIKGISEDQLAAIFQAFPLAKSLIEVVSDFKAVLKTKDQQALLLWIDKALALQLVEIDSFVTGIKHDIDAVMNAIVSDFSNGLAEGTVNKIKVIKRIMYGRCNFSLLKNKCLLLQEYS